MHDSAHHLECTVISAHAYLFSWCSALLDHRLTAVFVPGLDHNSYACSGILPSKAATSLNHPVNLQWIIIALNVIHYFCTAAMHAPPYGGQS